MIFLLEIKAKPISWVVASLEEAEIDMRGVWFSQSFENST